MKKLFTILLVAKFMILFSGQIMASDQYCCVPYDPIIQPISDDLTSNRYSALPEGTLQLTAFYDGNGQADLGVQVKDMATGDIEWIDVQVPPFGIQIPTWEFNLTGHEPTGLFHVGNVVENGVVDGLAFGIFWRDDDGNYHHLQSNNAQAEYIATYASAWPLGMNDIVFASRTPQLSDSFGREQARMMLYGAKLLKNGCYKFHIDMNSELPNRCRIMQPILAPISDDFTSNRYSGMENGTLQITAWYDGLGKGKLGIELADANGHTAWIAINKVRPFGDGITTFEYDITGWQPTGLFRVDKIKPNGVIDGLAFGLFWKDDNGKYHHIQSKDAMQAPSSNFVSAWPIGLNDTRFTELTPQLTTREQARMMLYGAKYLTKGCYSIPLDVDSQLRF